MEAIQSITMMDWHYENITYLRVDFHRFSGNSHLPLSDGQVKNAKSTTSYLSEGLDYRGRRVYSRIHFGTRHHFVPLKMVEVTGDTDGTVEFDCAILNAGRPGAVKCRTQCANCKVVYNALTSTDSGDSGDSVLCGVFTEPQPPTVTRSRKRDYLYFWVGYVFGLYRLKR